MPLCRLSSSLHNRRIVQIKPDDLPVVDNKSMPVVYPVPSKIVCLLMDAWHEGSDNRRHCSGDAASRRWDKVCEWPRVPCSQCHDWREDKIVPISHQRAA